MQTHSPEIIYRQQLQSLAEKQKQLARKKNSYAWLRFFLLVGAVLALWQCWPISIALAFIAFIILFGCFLFVVVQDLNNKEAIANNRILIDLNHQELAFLQHQYHDKYDGAQHKPPTHAYANDLDILGHASLYQYSNRTRSQQGQQLFADWLLYAADPLTISARQVAAKEMAPAIEWYQQLSAYGIENPITTTSEKKIEQWLASKNSFRGKMGWAIVRYAFPVVALVILFLFLNGTLPGSLLSPVLIGFFFIGYSISKIILPHYGLLSKMVPELETLQKSIRWIETHPFKSPLLQQLQANLQNDRSKASSTIKQLQQILARFDYRMNPLVHVPLNSIFLWDLQQMMALEKWKSDNTHTITVWYKTLADTEAICSIATLVFNHPQWAFPSLSEEDAVLTGEDFGHPLIPAEKRVPSSFSTQGVQQLTLITGSNMAGKSTFLRTIGINIVLAMAGAPVCCKRLLISPMHVLSTMRISDNLEENTSTFYAELKKLKDIIESVNNHEKVFLLLDEILRGTNSADRHTGSMALIRQLVKEKAVGMIATHDLELAKMASEYPGHIHNYHFDVQVAGEELYFDYKLKQGVCKSMNASILMKKIGINL